MKQIAGWCDTCKEVVRGESAEECPVCGRPATPLVLMREVLTSIATRVRVHDGDVVVFECPNYVTTAAHETLQIQWEKIVPGTRAVLLEGGMRIGAILGREQ